MTTGDRPHAQAERGRLPIIQPAGILSRCRGNRRRFTRVHARVTHILQRLYESEIAFVVGTLRDCGFYWKLGDQINGFLAVGCAETFDDAVADLAHVARQKFPESAFARGAACERDHPPWSARAPAPPG
jgi:hypothetical protein